MSTERPRYLLVSCDNPEDRFQVWGVRGIVDRVVKAPNGDFQNREHALVYYTGGGDGSKRAALMFARDMAVRAGRPPPRRRERLHEP